MEMLKEELSEINQKIIELQKDYLSVKPKIKNFNQKNKTEEYNEARNFIYWYNQNLINKQNNKNPVYQLYEEEQMDIYDHVPLDYKIDYNPDDYQDVYEADPEYENKVRVRRITVWLSKYKELKIEYTTLSEELKTFTEKAADISTAINDLEIIAEQHNIPSTPTNAYNPDVWNQVLENADSFIKHLNNLTYQIKLKLDRMLEAINTIENDTDRIAVLVRFIKDSGSKEIREALGGITDNALRSRVKRALKEIKVSEEDLEGIEDPKVPIRYNSIRPNGQKFNDLMDRLRRNDIYLDKLNVLLKKREFLIEGDNHE